MLPVLSAGSAVTIVKDPPHRERDGGRNGWDLLGGLGRAGIRIARRGIRVGYVGIRQAGYDLIEKLQVDYGCRASLLEKAPVLSGELIQRAAL
jgi:hypothetical protein